MQQRGQYRTYEGIMPRRSKGARLWLRPPRRKGRRIIANAVWIILDGKQHFATGCLAHQIGEAERCLADYVSSKYRPARHARDIAQIDVADVLSIYLDDCGARVVDQPKLERCITRLNNYWGGKMLSEITNEECRAYVRSRGKIGGARSDLETLRAAINHHAKQNLHRETVHVSLPAKGQPRDRWLTRTEAGRLLWAETVHVSLPAKGQPRDRWLTRTETGRLLWACWRYREKQTVHRGKQRGNQIETDKRSLRHLARFILIGLYTGTRAGAIASASPYRDLGHSFVDLDQGIFYRLAIGHRASKKRQPPAPVPERLLAHMRRWVRRGVITSHFVEWNGAPVKSVKTAFNHAVKVAGLWGRVTPHTLPHTAALWLMQRGVPIWQAAGYLGMSAEVLERTYGHHHPDYMRGAAQAITSKQVQNVSLVVSLADQRNDRQKRRNPARLEPATKRL
jgi:integrase